MADGRSMIASFQLRYGFDLCCYRSGNSAPACFNASMYNQPLHSQRLTCTISHCSTSDSLKHAQFKPTVQTTTYAISDLPTYNQLPNQNSTPPAAGLASRRLWRHNHFSLCSPRSASALFFFCCQNVHAQHFSSSSARSAGRVAELLLLVVLREDALLNYSSSSSSNLRAGSNARNNLLLVRSSEKSATC